MTEKLRTWVELGTRLLVASPNKWDEVVRLVRLIVEGQELISARDRELFLRGRRPLKRYEA